MKRRCTIVKTVTITTTIVKCYDRLQSDDDDAIVRFCSGEGMASIFVSCMMQKNKNGQIQLLLKAQILALKMRVSQTIGINMVWRTHIFSKIQVKMSRSKI